MFEILYTHYLSNIFFVSTYALFVNLKITKNEKIAALFLKKFMVYHSKDMSLFFSKAQFLRSKFVSSH